MLEGLSNFIKKISIPINLIRLEIFFGAIFCLFFTVFINIASDLEINLILGLSSSFLFFLIGFLSFLPKLTQGFVRVLSNLVYILGFTLVLYVVYLNQFSNQAFYILLINYALFCFSLSSTKVFFRLNIILWVLTFSVVAFLNFNTIISIPFLVLSYITIGLAGYSTTHARSLSKKKHRERSKYLSVVFNNSSNALVLLKGDQLQFIDANERAYLLFGFTRKEVTNTFDINDLKVGNEYIFRKLKKEEKKTIELSDQRLLRIDTKKVVQGKQIYYLIEIEQFKDRLELSEELEFEKLKTINDETYENLFRNNPSLISIVNRNGKIIDINDTYLEFVGYLKSEVVGRKHSILDYRDYSKEGKIIRQKAWEGETQLFEKEIVSKDGTVLFIEIIVRKSKYFGEEVLMSNARDISHNKMLEKIADYNQSQYSTLFRESPIGLFISDLDGDIVEVNQSFEKLLGYKKEELLGRNISLFSKNKKSELHKESWSKLKQGSVPFIELQTTYTKKNGEVIFILLKVNLQKDEDNIPAKLLGQVVDITNFVSAVKSLKASVKSYKDVFNTSFELRYILNEKNEFIDVNNSVEKEYGYTKEELLGKTPDFLGELSKMDFTKMTQKLIDTWNGEEQEILWWSKRKDGSVFPKRLHLKLGVYFGEKVLMCSGQNIQQYYDYENSILRSEKKYKDLINQTIFGILIFKDRKVVFANQRAIDILKYDSVDELVGLKRSNIFQLKEIQILNSRESSLMAGDVVNLREFELMDSTGEFIPVESIAAKIDFEGEECILSSFVEITNRKQIEEVKLKAEQHKTANDSLRLQLEQNRTIQRRLQNSQSYSEGIIESSLDMIFTTDTKGRITKMNSAAKQQFGYERKEFIQQTFGLLLREKEAEQEIIEALNLARAYSGERFMKRKNGTTFPSLLSISQLFNTEGTFMGMMGISRDISDIVSKESEIKKQSLKLNSIIESSSHFFFTINKNYRLTSFNRLFWNDVKTNYNIELELFDDYFSLVKVAEKSNDVTVSFWKEIFDKAFEGESSEFEVNRKNYNGVPFHREIYINPILSTDGKIEEISGIGHDITQKKQNELELKNSLHEKEILLKEVHHRVKNNMQVISSILSLQSSYVTDEHVLEVLKESRNRIAAMASIHERLYRTTNLSDIKFSSYIKDLAESLINTYELSNVSVKLVFSLDEVFLSLNQAIPCGLILNELISNSLKYAFVGRDSGKIEVILISDSEKISLSLADNGVGIPEELDIYNTDTLGLQLVSTLVDQMEGNLLLEKENGTKFTVSFITNTEV